jgi:hypothetical protein
LGDKLIIDLHVHTKVFSSDSSLDPEEAIQEAKGIGLDGICFTEHNKAWEAEQIHRYSSRWNFPVLCGVEVDTIEGHVLVFGLNRDFGGVIRVHELREWVNEAGGVMIVVHPFKGFRVFGFSDLQLSPEQASKRPIFQSVDAIEAFSGRTMEKESNLAQEVSRQLGLKVVGGSDAHSVSEIGRCVTIFDNNIDSEAELITELKAGRFHAGYFRK